MAKLARCPAGHVYDRDAHASCPACARSGIEHKPVVPPSGAHPEDVAIAAASGGKPSLPVNPMLIGLAAAAVLAVGGYLLLGGSSAISDPVLAKQDPDYAACAKADRVVEACDKAIGSEKFAGAALGEMYRLRGFARASAKQPDTTGAIADYTEAIALEAGNLVPLILRSSAYIDAGQNELAIKDLDEVVAKQPRWDLYSDRGLAHLRRNDLDKAIADFDKSIEMKSNEYLSYWNRGLAWKRKSEKSKAAADFNKALSLDPPDDIRKKLEAALKEVSGEAKPPEPAAEGAKKSEADTAPKEQQAAAKPKVLRGDEEVVADSDFAACRTRGPSQIDDCKRAIASGKFDGTALAVLHNNLGRAYSFKPDRDAALESFEKAIALAPNLAVAIANRGTILYAKKEYDRALADLEKAITLDPQRAFNYYQRGLTLWAKGDSAAAAADCKKALELDPPDNIRKECEAALKMIAQGITQLTPGNDKKAVTKPPEGPIRSIDEAKSDADISLGQPDAQKSASLDDDKNSAISGAREGGKDAVQPGPESSPAVVPPAGPIVPASPVITLRTGVYRLTGQNPTGEKYYGQARITQQRDDIRATVWNGDKLLQGKGSFADGVLTLKYNTGLRVAYKLNSDGTYDGAWWRGSGTERLEPVGMTPETPLQIAEGQYRIATIMENGKHVSGTVQVSKTARGYHLDWVYDDGDKMKGDGALADNVLVISHKENRDWPKDAAVIYALQADGSLVGLYASGFARETLVPLAAPPVGAGDASAAVTTTTPSAADAVMKDAQKCMGTIGAGNVDTSPCDRALASGQFSKASTAGLFNQRGTLHFMNKRDDAALADVDRAIELMPDDPLYLANRGAIELSKGDYDKAIADLSRAITLKPTGYDDYQSRALAYTKKGLPAEARKDYEKALSLNPDADTREKIEKALQELGPDYTKMKAQ